MTAHQVGLLMVWLAAIIALARILGIAARRLGQPPVIGEIAAGLLLGPTLFGKVLLPVDISPALSGLANVGLVLFMFIVGYELDHALVRGRARVAVSVSVGSIVLPLGLGAALGVWLAQRHGITDVAPFALFIGAAMAVTAFPVLARIITDRGMQRTEVGGLALAGAAVDDVLAWSLLAVVVTIGGATADTGWHLFFAAPYLAVMFFGVRPLLRRLLAARARAGRLTPDHLAIVLIGLLLSCYATEWLGVHAIFGAFIFGAVMPRGSAPEAGVLRHEIMERLEQVSVLLLLPAFFVLAGMKVDLSKVDIDGAVELAAILAVAIGGKFLGAYLGGRLQRLKHYQAGALAVLMNTRGLTEIVILTVGLQLGLLDSKLFSLMVLMALITTMMTGPLLSLVYPKRKVERDIADAERKALGESDSFRILVPQPTAELVRQAIRLASGRPAAQIVLSRLLPYPAAPLEMGALSGELVQLTRAMSDLAELAKPVRDNDFGAPVLAGFSNDIAEDFLRQTLTSRADVVLLSRDIAGYQGMRARVPQDVLVVEAYAEVDEA